MEEITQYKTDDGKIFNCREDAAYHELLLEKVEEIESLLKPEDKRMINGGGYVQHDKESAKKALSMFTDLVFSSRDYLWLRRNEYKETLGVILRAISDSKSVHPFGSMANRLFCIDDEGREFDQPFYKKNSYGISELSPCETNK